MPSLFISLTATFPKSESPPHLGFNGEPWYPQELRELKSGPRSRWKARREKRTLRERCCTCA